MHILGCLKGGNGNLYFSGVIANLTSFLVGYSFAWASIAIPRLDGTIQPEHNPLRITILQSQIIWIVTLVPVGAATSALLTGYLTERRGRKELLVVATLLSTLGCAIIYFAMSPSYLFIGRLVLGFAVGSVLTVTPLYLGEIAEPRNRGLLSMLIGTFIILGMLITYALSAFVTLNDLNLIFFVISFIFLLMIDWWLPESPYWLLSQERLSEAEISLRKIRKGSYEDITRELVLMKKYIEESCQYDIDLLNIFKRKDALKGLCISCGLVIFQQISGVNVILFYIQPSFKETEDNFPKEPPTIIISIVQILSCVVAAIFVDTLGRKGLLLASTIGSGLSLVALGTFFHLQNSSDIMESLYWLPIVSTVCFMVTYALGLGPVPFVILGEIFPHRIKATASALTIFVCLIFTICMTSIFTPLSIAIGVATTFWMLAAICLISGLILYCYIPETKGKSLQNIQEILQK